MFINFSVSHNDDETIVEWHLMKQNMRIFFVIKLQNYMLSIYYLMSVSYLFTYFDIFIVKVYLF